MKEIFSPADILLPRTGAPEKWSVIACDQFSSDPSYWERVRKLAGTNPSTLNMIIPEVYLGETDEVSEVKKIKAVMDQYLGGEVFHEIGGSFIFVTRTLSNGLARRGLVGTIDLDAYDFSGEIPNAPILASENTVLDRLPPRIRVRRAVPLELPHIIAFIDDIDMTVIEPLSEKAGSMPALYDFDLNENGGHIKGVRVSGEAASGVVRALDALNKRGGALMVIGDGNHSLAAAKVFWEELKQTLSSSEAERHPAGRALVELNNVYDPAISFEAIHRVLFDVNPAAFLDSLKAAMKPGNGYRLQWVTLSGEGHIDAAAGCIGEMLETLQAFLDEYVRVSGCGIDYIHDEDTLVSIAAAERRVGLILPAMDKRELFGTVVSSGVFPKKSFSVGSARDKRYYLECRKITGGM